MNGDKIHKAKNILAKDMKKYVKIILSEYIEVIPNSRRNFLESIDSFDSRVFVKDSGTISMYATNNGIVMPKGAYKIFNIMKKVPGYGKNKNHKTYNKVIKRI